MSTGLEEAIDFRKKKIKAYDLDYILI